MPTTATTDDKACCWICLEEGNDGHGKPLTRNCACRGDSGWAHVACLARFAKVKSDGLSAYDYAKMIKSCKGTAWSVCHTCKQEYHGNVAISLANEWVDSVAGLDDASPQRIAAMSNFVMSSMLHKVFDVAIQTCEDLRGTLHSNKQDIDHMLWAHAENRCLGMLASANASLGNMEQAREYAEKYKSFNKSMCLSNPDEVDASMEIMLEGLTPGEDQGRDEIRLLTDMYNNAVQTNGKDSPFAIKSATSLAQAMFEAQNIKESYQWYKDAHDRAKRVFGKDNPDYITIKWLYLPLSIMFGPRLGTLVLDHNKLNGKEVSILRTTKDGKKYIVDIGSEAGLSEKVKVIPSQLIFAVDTPVTAKSLGRDRALYIDSFEKETNSYKVFAMRGVKGGDEHAYLDVPRKDVAVIFSSQFSSQLGI